MPKKRNSTVFAKPTGYVHPSLSASTPAASSIRSGPLSRLADKTATSSTVNDLIANSRRNQNHITEDDRRALTALATAPTVHPSLKDILQVADIPIPRPKVGMRPPMRGIRGGPRGPAGPAPPSSWLSASRHAPPDLRKGEDVPDVVYDRSVERLPGMQQPGTKTLLHMALKALAIDWRWHVHYDQHYLATLPARLKSLILAYIAVYGSGVNVESLETLFQVEDELEDATGSEDVTHLDLSSSVGHSITFSQLNKYFTMFRKPASQTSEMQDSWEDEVIVFNPGSLATPRFPHLTHLSLAHPAPTAAWSDLIIFLPHLATLTHLSLAHWPWPSQKPNAKTTSVISKDSALAVDYGASNYYSIYDGDNSEAAIMLRRLSKATYCLRWLDLQGCTEWLPALTWKPNDENLEVQGPRWNNEWRQIETIVVSQDWIPECYREPPPGASQQDFSSSAILSDQRDLLRGHYRHTNELQTLSWRLREQVITGTARKISNCRADVGGLRVEFVRGWKGWWIEEALWKPIPTKYKEHIPYYHRTLR